MTSLNTINKCDTHSPKWSAISTSHGIEYTFCENCEQNIDRFYVMMTMTAYHFGQIGR